MKAEPKAPFSHNYLHPLKPVIAYLSLKVGLDTTLGGLSFVVLMVKVRWGMLAQVHIRLKLGKLTLGFPVANYTRSDTANGTGNTIG